ncbi:uncharacterized protein LOC113284604 [Papaver somniferum]|uniref:uncharacterized protein LOC113284604 n=1 Tax=Papaver somniferum TaxID=3469 RepID=UPI000E6FEFCA|nr:uncharacterized protein LOC113284604 [Papaver somniferum]
MGGSMDVNFESHLHGDDNSSSRVGLFGASNNRVSSNLRWSDMLGVGKDEPLHDLIPYAPPGLVGGKKLTVFSDDEVEDDVHRCEKLVVGCFVGKRLPFLMVRNFAKRVWKLKGEMKMTLLGDAVFVFEFDSAEDRAMALEHGCLFISGQPFVVGPWSLMIEQELAELKTIPIWINLRNVRLHLWNSKGLVKAAAEAAAEATAEVAAAKKLAEASKAKDKPVGGNEGWVVKNRKRGRNKNSNQQKSSTAGLDGASTSGTANMVEVPIMMNNKFHQLTEEGTGEFMEVVMTTTTKDNHRLTPFGSNDTADGSQVCPQPLSLISGVYVGNREVGDTMIGFVLNQVERLDEGQKENDGARTHFLPKSSIQGKNMLNVKAAEKKSPKVKKPNPSLLL